MKRYTIGESHEVIIAKAANAIAITGLNDSGEAFAYSQPPESYYVDALNHASEACDNKCTELEAMAKAKREKAYRLLEEADDLQRDANRISHMAHAFEQVKFYLEDLPEKMSEKVKEVGND